MASQAERRLSARALVVVVVPRVGRRGAGGRAGPALTGPCVAGWGPAGEMHGTSAPRACWGGTGKGGVKARLLGVGRAGGGGGASKWGRRCCKQGRGPARWKGQARREPWGSKQVRGVGRPGGWS